MNIVTFMKLFYKMRDALSRVPQKPSTEIVDVIRTLPWNKSGVKRNKWGYRPLSIISKVIVHQAMSKGPTENINAYHISEDSHLKPGGAPHIAYHYTIEKDGTIFHCNKDTSITWHTKGQNTKSIGVCLIGDFNGRAEDGEAYVGKTNPSKPQLKSLNILLNKMMIKYSLQPEDIYGHSDFGKPACPGNKVQTWLENWR
jgi:N-acetyl-anhydromuramyl-L-alanine amidase AmpD